MARLTLKQKIVNHMLANLDSKMSDRDFYNQFFEEHTMKEIRAVLTNINDYRVSSERREMDYLYWISKD